MGAKHPLQSPFHCFLIGSVMDSLQAPRGSCQPIPHPFHAASLGHHLLLGIKASMTLSSWSVLTLPLSEGQQQLKQEHPGPVLCDAGTQGMKEPGGCEATAAQPFTEHLLQYSSWAYSHTLSHLSLATIPRERLYLPRWNQNWRLTGVK